MFIWNLIFHELRQCHLKALFLCHRLHLPSIISWVFLEFITVAAAVWLIWKSLNLHGLIEGNCEESKVEECDKEHIERENIDEA